ncbi:MAG: 4Fe-4S binding protein [Candidatus Tectomicrobia bacterium]|nr:4Fe-4S binding protein [Candidatus Tectomicrobia bacterium]
MKPVRSYSPADYFVRIDHEKCVMCELCVRGCTFDVLGIKDGKIISDDHKCTSCEYCVAVCPVDCIEIDPNPMNLRQSPTWTSSIRHTITKQSSTGGKLLTAMGSDANYPNYWDRILLDACQVTNPSIDPLREPMEIRTYLGRKPEKLEFFMDEERKPTVTTQISPLIRMEAPIIFSAMSFGAISLNAHKALSKAAHKLGIIMNVGEGGTHSDLYQYRDNIMVQCASGRFGVDKEYLNNAAAIEIKIGQGAKPGIGGHLPGIKVYEEISKTRMIPLHTDAISPAPHHDIYSIEDLRMLIYALKEATEYTKPVGVKIAATHNVASIASGIARAGADFITIDGFRGGTGAAPKGINDNVGIPIELALAAVDDRLTKEGLRNQVTLTVCGTIRGAGDMVKAIALGADVVAIGTSALIALGCTRIKLCHTNRCPWGIATHDPMLTKRLDPEWGTERLCNMITSWTLELKEFMGALGLNSIESLRGNRDRLRGVGMTEGELNILGIKHAGE